VIEMEKIENIAKFNSIQFIDQFYSPSLSKFHYGRALYSSRKMKQVESRNLNMFQDDH